MKTMLVTTTSVLLTLVTMDTPAVLTVKTRRRSSATSTPRRTPVRSPSRLARRLWTPSILKSVRRESTLFERSHHSTRVVDHHSKVIASSDYSGHHEAYGGHHSTRVVDHHSKVIASSDYSG